MREGERMLLPFSFASARPFTCLLPAGIASVLTRSNPLKHFFFETPIGVFSSGYFMNKANDCLMIVSYICGLNSELFFLHTDKNHSFFLLLETNKCRKEFEFSLYMYMFMFALN